MFSQLSQDLARTRPDLQEVILCPLCLTSFDKSAIYGNDPFLTEEHVVPGAVGGKRMTLTCRRCNNEQGSSIDSHVVSMIRNWDAIEGAGSHLAGTIRFSDLKFSVKVSWTKQDNGEFVTNLSIPGGKQEEVGRLRSIMLRGDCREFKFDLNLKYNLYRMRLGLLRMAYLAMFVHAGYDYIVGPAPNRIRTALMRIEPAPEKFLNEHIELTQVSHDPPDSLIIVPYHSEATLIGYFVIIRLLGSKPRYFAVVMPPAELDGSRVFDHLLDVMKVFDGRQFSMQVIPSVENS
jgi:hypothetical protein